MVEYYYHKACVIAEEKLMSDLHKMRISEAAKRQKVHGILTIIEPCNHVLEVNFPLQRDDGSYQMITGYRAQVPIKKDLKGEYLTLVCFKIKKNIFCDSYCIE